MAFHDWGIFIKHNKPRQTKKFRFAESSPQSLHLCVAYIATASQAGIILDNIAKVCLPHSMAHLLCGGGCLMGWLDVWLMEWHDV